MTEKQRNILDNPIDDEGYPTEDYLYLIKNWIPETCAFEEVLNSILFAWNYGADAYNIHYDLKTKGVIPVEFHTLGWSGNELIMSAVFENIYITYAFLKHRATETGGHYYFVLTDEEYDIETSHYIWKVKLQAE